MDYSVLIWSICLFVESRVQGEVNLEELALQSGFSLAHIRDVFRRNTGKALSCYVQERKIACAALMRKDYLPMMHGKMLFYEMLISLVKQYCRY